MKIRNAFERSLRHIGLRIAFMLVLSAAPGKAVFAQDPAPPTSAVPAETAVPKGTPTAQAITPAFDPASATRAYIDSIPADKRARSDAYFEGTYWLLLWNFLLGSGVALLLLNARISARLRDFAERKTRFKALQVALYAIPYVLLVTVLTFPLDAYEGYFREHAYEMSNQTFGEWFGEQAKGLGLELVGMPLLLMALYAVFRRAPRTWWIWGSGVLVAFMLVGIMIAPVFIEPIFNTYKPVTNTAISEPILTMARANQIPVAQVFEVDASKQTKRVSANVSGFMGTARIALNDNLLKQCTLPEIRMVMAHEMGHYVLNHMGKFVVFFGVIFVIGFALGRVVFEACMRRWGTRWGVRGIADPAGFPLLLLIFSTYLFLLTPVFKTIIRSAESEADAFGLNVSREPDGFAKAALKLGVYRKMDPGPLEEFLMFDHPSGRTRIRMAMDWKAANMAARLYVPPPAVVAPAVPPATKQ